MSVSRGILGGVCAFLLSLRAATGQGTFTVTFDGPPRQPPGTQSGVTYYHEAGVSFLPIGGSGTFTRNGGGILGYPDNGTPYVQAMLGDSLMFGMDDGSSFDPVSVDLAEYSDVLLLALDPVTVHFVGYRPDGTVLTDDITTAGLFNGVAPVFTNFTFDPGFSGLVRVEIPTIAWSLDNLTLRRSVPEPGTGALMGIGTVLLGIRRLRGRRAESYRTMSPRSFFLGAGLCCLLSVLAASAQGTFTVTFDGPPQQPPGTASLLRFYDEAGVWFTPIPGSEYYDFGLRGSNPTPGWPDDGTAYVQAAVGSTLMFGLDDGSSFDPISVDLAEYSDILLLMRGPETVHFVGYRPDGTVLTDDITTAGIFNGVAPVFTTFTFDPGFSGLVRVEIPTIAWSLDNLTLRRSVPEPGIGALLLVGAVLVAFGSCTRSRQ